MIGTEIRALWRVCGGPAYSSEERRIARRDEAGRRGSWFLLRERRVSLENNGDGAQGGCNRLAAESGCPPREERRSPIAAGASLWRLNQPLSEARRIQTLSVFGLFLSVVTGLAGPAFLLSTGGLVRAVGAPGLNPEPIEPFVYTQLVIGGVCLLSGFGSAFTLELAAEKRIRLLQKKIFTSVLAASDVRSAERLDYGQVAAFVAVYRAGAGVRRGQILQCCTAFLGGYAVALFRAWRLALVLLTAVPATTAVICLVAYFLRAHRSAAADAVARAQSLQKTALKHWDEVTMNNAQTRVADQYAALQHTVMYPSVRASLLAGIGLASVTAIIFATYAIGFWYGGLLIAWDQLGGCRLPGDPAAAVPAFLAKTAVAAEPATAVAQAATAAGSAVAAGGGDAAGAGSVIFRGLDISLGTRTCLHGGDILTSFLGVMLGALAMGQAVVPVTCVLKSKEAKRGLAAFLRQNKLSSRLPAATVVPPVALRGALRFDAVSFRYSKSSMWLFRDLSFAIPACGTTMIVGPSGVGKSTILGLCARFFDVEEALLRIEMSVDCGGCRTPKYRTADGADEGGDEAITGEAPRAAAAATADATAAAGASAAGAAAGASAASGCIFIDDLPIHSLPLSYYRSQVGVVNQRPQIFTRSALSNVLSGRPRATREELWAALSQAGLESGLEGGLGNAESLGSSEVVKYRVSLARALLRDPPVLLVDEPPQAIFTGELCRLAVRLDGVTPRTLVILTTLNSVQHFSSPLLRTADRIVMLKRTGSGAAAIAEVGAYADLMRRDGPFKRMVYSTKARLKLYGKTTSGASAVSAFSRRDGGGYGGLAAQAAAAVAATPAAAALFSGSRRPQATDSAASSSVSNRRHTITSRLSQDDLLPALFAAPEGALRAPYYNLRRRQTLAAIAQENLNSVVKAIDDDSFMQLTMEASGVVDASFTEGGGFGPPAVSAPGSARAGETGGTFSSGAFAGSASYGSAGDGGSFPGGNSAVGDFTGGGSSADSGMLLVSAAGTTSGSPGATRTPSPASRYSPAKAVFGDPSSFARAFSPAVGEEGHGGTTAHGVETGATGGRPGCSTGATAAAGVPGASSLPDFPGGRKRVLAVLGPHRRVFFLSLAGAGVFGVIFPLFVFFAAQYLDIYFGDNVTHITHESARYAPAFLLLGAFGFASLVVQRAGIELSSARLKCNLRIMAFGALLRQDAAFFDAPRDAVGAAAAAAGTAAVSVRASSECRDGPTATPSSAARSALRYLRGSGSAAHSEVRKALLCQCGCSAPMIAADVAAGATVAATGAAAGADVAVKAPSSREAPRRELDALAEDLLVAGPALVAAWAVEEVPVSVQAVTTLAAGLAVAALASARLALVVGGAFACAMPLVILKVRFQRKAAAKSSRGAGAATVKLLVAETLENFRAVQANGLAPQLRAMFRSVLDANYRNARRAAAYAAAFTGAALLAQCWCQSLCLWYGGLLLRRSLVRSPGALLQAIAALNLAAIGVAQFLLAVMPSSSAKQAAADLFATAERVPAVRSVAAERHAPLPPPAATAASDAAPCQPPAAANAILPPPPLSSPPATPAATLAATPPSAAPLLTVRRLNFSRVQKGATRLVLTNINLQVDPGETIGILGALGSQKSTIMKILARMYPVGCAHCKSGATATAAGVPGNNFADILNCPARGRCECEFSAGAKCVCVAATGEIRMDGQEISLYDVAELRNMIGYVGRESVLFENVSVRANICLGRAEATEADMVAAARAANAHAFITALSEGYDTVVSGDQSFAEGEKRRIVLARAFLKNPRLLLLDEPTCSLMPLCARKVRAALNRFARSAARTSGIVLCSGSPAAMMRFADRVYVLAVDARSGASYIAETGPPEFLLKRPHGLFRTLVKGCK